MFLVMNEGLAQTIGTVLQRKPVSYKQQKELSRPLGSGFEALCVCVCWSHRRSSKKESEGE